MRRRLVDALMRRPRVLVIHYGRSSFVETEICLLAQDFDVTDFEARFRKGLGRRLRHVYPALWRAINRSDAVFWWFAHDFAFAGAIMAKLRGRPFVLVAGGHDVGVVREARYGRTRRPGPRRWATILALRLATRVLAVSEMTRAEAANLAGGRAIQTVPLAVDGERFHPGPNGSLGLPRPRVTTVARVDDRSLRLKGLLSFARASVHVPEADFVVVGPVQEDARRAMQREGGANLHFAGFLSQEDLAVHLRETAVYCQLSLRESFGMALAEAISCGCAAVVSSAQIGVMDHVGDIVERVSSVNEREVATAIRRALIEGQSTSRRRVRHDVVARRLSMETRRRALQGIMTAVLAGRGTERRHRNQRKH